MNFRLNSIALTLSVLVFSVSLVAQNTVLDSLKQELASNIKTDSLRVNLLNELANSYLENNQEGVLPFLAEADSIATTIAYKKGRARSAYLNGLLASKKRDFKKASSYFDAALLLYQELKIDHKIAECYEKLALTAYYDSDFSRAIDFYKKTATAYQKTGNTKNTAISFKYLGHCYTDIGEYTTAQDFYNQAIAINTKYNYSLELSSCYLNIGSVYLKKSNYPIALENYKKSLEISEKHKDTLGISKALNNLGIIYKNYEDYDKAIDNYQRSLAIQKKIGSQRNISVALANLGSAYMNKQEYEEALSFFNKALVINKEENDRTGIAKNLNNIGRVYNELNQLEQGREYALASLEITQQIGRQLGQCYSHILIAQSYTKQKLYNNALPHAKNAMTIANNLNLLGFQADAYKVLSDIYKYQGQYKEALSWHEKFRKYSDSLFNKENVEKITQLEFEYKYKRALDSASIREMTLTQKVRTTSNSLEKSQRNIFLTIIVFLATAILLGGIIFYLKLRNEKAKTQNIAIEQKLLRSQMTPHFIFNSLSVLQGMILNKEEKKSVSYLSKFSKLLRITLENSRDKMVPLSQELAGIDNYIDLQNLDAHLPFNYRLKIDKQIDKNRFEIPPMLIQPFIENAIEHAYVNQKENREIAVDIVFKNNQLICTISDNGIGIDSFASKANSNKKSLATTITSERLAMLAKDFKQDATVTIEDRKKYNQKGTLVTLVIPYKRNAL